ncbi:MAG: S41 family peptidase [Victivallaceae bacterium]
MKRNMKRGWLNLIMLVSVFAGHTLAGQTETSTADTSAPARQEKSIDINDEGYNSVTLMMTVIELLRKYYVDKDKVKYEKLVSGALKGILSELDPFCVYESPAVHRQTEQKFSGKLVGVGIVVMKAQDGSIRVVAPSGDDSPGFKAGIQPDDLITQIDGKKTATMSIEECVTMMQGQPGTKITLTIFRKSTGKILTFVFNRSEIRTSPVPFNGVKVLNGNIGYIRLSLFSAETGPAMDKALEVLEKQKIKGIILDLRYNPGGLLGAAVDVCSRFIKEGELVIYTEGREKSDRVNINALKCRKDLEIPIVILVNNYSASGSEIVAGCLKDHKRAVLVGTKTYGKGSVQRIQPLPNGGAIRFTIAHYYTPSARLIDGKGIEPDIDVPVPYNDSLQMSQQLAIYPGEIRPDKPAAITDVELLRATQILEGIIRFNASRTE